MMRRRVLRFLLPLSVFASIVAPAPLPASASCDDAVVTCETDHDTTELQPMSVRRISTTMPLRTDNEGVSFEVYEGLVPAAYEVPALPRVALTFSEISTPNRSLADAGAGEVWIEGSLSIRVQLGDETGWYPISRWTDSSSVYQADRSVGSPAHLATGSFSLNGTVWSADASVGGMPSVRAVWSPGNLPVGEDNVRVADDQDPYLTVSPALEGETRYRTRYTPKPWVPGLDTIGDAPEDYPDPTLGLENVTVQKKWQKGWVTVTIDPDLNRLDADSPEPLPDLPFGEGLSLADMISTQQTWPGIFWDTDRTLITQRDNLDDGQDGIVPQKGSVPGQGVVTAATIQTAATAFTPYAVVLPQGSSLTFVNLDTAGTHNVASVRQGSDNAPLFQSSFAAAGGVQEVRNVENLQVGRYLFVCQAHGNMKGALVIR
jgi:plastocyanin